MPVLVIVSCGMKKIWNSHPNAGPTLARDTYVGAPFRVNREYAEKFADRWVILSAKYGFIDPEFVIPDNYDVTFKRIETNPVGVERLREQIRQKAFDRFDKVIVLGGRDYGYFVRRSFEDLNVKIVTPTFGLSLGRAMAKVRKAIEDNVPLDC